jgi:hypothetical protein
MYFCPFMNHLVNRRKGVSLVAAAGFVFIAAVVAIVFVVIHVAVVFAIVNITNNTIMNCSGDHLFTVVQCPVPVV